MSPIKFLNNLLLMENLLGIYRKHCIQKKIKKYLIIIQLFFQTMLYTVAIIIKLYFFLKGGVQANLIYTCLTAFAYLSSMLSIMTGICYSRSFISYYRSIWRLSEWFKDDSKLINSVKKLYWFSITFTLLYIAFVIFRALEIFKKIQHSNELVLYIIIATQTAIRITVVFQHFMLFVVIMIVVYLSKCLSSLISAVEERVGSCDVNSDEQRDITTEQIQGWVELYRDLANCCEKVTLCFGRQCFFSTVLSMLNYILIICQICNLLSPNKGHIDELRNVVISTFTYGLLMLLPIVAGQLTHNQGVKIHRVLARLYNRIIITGEAEAKLIKDFIRLIKKNPLEIKLLSKIPAGMYMLPVITTLAVNYLIVVLQFNHVI